MQLREMETKNEYDSCFAQARYLLTKLCNIFDEAFLFDVSILGRVRTSNISLAKINCQRNNGKLFAFTHSNGKC